EEPRREALTLRIVAVAIDEPPDELAPRGLSAGLRFVSLFAQLRRQRLRGRVRLRDVGPKMSDFVARLSVPPQRPAVVRTRLVGDAHSHALRRGPPLERQGGPLLRYRTFLRGLLLLRLAEPGALGVHCPLERLREAPGEGDRCSGVTRPPGRLYGHVIPPRAAQRGDGRSDLLPDLRRVVAEAWRDNAPRAALRADRRPREFEQLAQELRGDLVHLLTLSGLPCQQRRALRFGGQGDCDGVRIVRHLFSPFAPFAGLAGGGADAPPGCRVPPRRPLLPSHRVVTAGAGVEISRRLPPLVASRSARAPPHARIGRASAPSARDSRRRAAARRARTPRP